MKRSTDRILTTHTGSLPRAAKVIELLLAERQHWGARKAELNAAVGEATRMWCRSRSSAASMSSTTANRAAPTIPCT